MPGQGISNSIFRVRFHGRGGQGMKTASRILGKAFFLEGFEVQDAPRYGAERRGAPIFAYVRVSHESINERGIIRCPDLVIVADETLVEVPSAGVLQGVGSSTRILIYSRLEPDAWAKRFPLLKNVVTLPLFEDDRHEHRYISSICAGAAARLAGIVSRARLEEAVRLELAEHGDAVVQANQSRALRAYDLTESGSGPGKDAEQLTELVYSTPDWIELPFEPAMLSAPSIHATLTSEQVATGLWRTMRPVVDGHLCQRCGLCSSLCPEGAISLDDTGAPVIDYEHCKGCMICVVECPAHAIQPRPEHATGRERP